MRFPVKTVQRDVDYALFLTSSFEFHQMTIISVINLIITIWLIFSENNVLANLDADIVIRNCIFVFLMSFEFILCIMIERNVSKPGHKEQSFYEIEGMPAMPFYWNLITYIFGVLFLVVSIVLFAADVDGSAWVNILLYRVTRFLRLLVITRFIWLFPALYEMIVSIGKTFTFLRWVLAIIITVCILTGDLFSGWLSIMRAYNDEPLEMGDSVDDDAPPGDVLWFNFSTLYRSFQATFSLLVSDNFGDMVAWFDDIAPGLSVLVYCFTIAMSLGLLQVVTAAFCGQFDDNKDSMRQMAEERRKMQFEELWASLVSFKTAARQKGDCLDGIAILQSEAGFLDLEVNYSDLSNKPWTVVVNTSEYGRALLKPVDLKEKEEMIQASSKLGSGLYTRLFDERDRPFLSKIRFWLAAVSEWIIDFFRISPVPLFRLRHAFAHCVLLEREDPVFPRYHFDSEKVSIEDPGSIPITNVGEDGVIEFLRDSPLIEFCDAESAESLSKSILSEYAPGMKSIPLIYIKHAVFRRSFDIESFKLNELGFQLSEFLTQQYKDFNKLSLLESLKMDGSNFKGPSHLKHSLNKIKIDLYIEQPCFAWANTPQFFDYTSVPKAVRSMVAKCQKYIKEVQVTYLAELERRCTFNRKQSRKYVSIPAIDVDEKHVLRDWPVCMANLHLTLRRPYLLRFGIWSPSWGICEAMALLRLLICSLENFVFLNDKCGSIEEQRSIIQLVRRLSEIRRKYDEPRFYDLWFGVMPLSEVMYRIHYTETLRTHLRYYVDLPQCIFFFKYYEAYPILLNQWEFDQLRLLLNDARTVAVTSDISSRWIALNDYYCEKFGVTSSDDKFRNFIDCGVAGHQIYSPVIARSPRLGFEKTLNSQLSPSGVPYTLIFNGKPEAKGDEYDDQFAGKQLPDDDPKKPLVLENLRSLIICLKEGLNKINEFEKEHPANFKEIDNALLKWGECLAVVGSEIQTIKDEYAGDEEFAPDFVKLEVGLLDRIKKIYKAWFPNKRNVIDYKFNEYHNILKSKINILEKCESAYERLISVKEFANSTEWFSSSDDVIEFLKVPGDTNDFRSLSVEQRRNYNSILLKRVSTLVNHVASRLPNDSELSNVLDEIDMHSYCGFYLCTYSVCPKSSSEFGLTKYITKLNELVHQHLSKTPRIHIWLDLLRILQNFQIVMDSWIKTNDIQKNRKEFSIKMFDHQRKTELAESSIVIDSLNTFCFDSELGSVIGRLFVSARENPGVNNENYWKQFSQVVQQIQQLPQILQNCLTFTGFSPLEFYSGETRILRILAQVSWLGRLNDTEATTMVRSYVRCFRKLSKLLEPVYPTSDNEFEFDFMKFATPSYIQDDRLLDLHWKSLPTISRPTLPYREIYRSRLVLLIHDFNKLKAKLIESDVPLPPMKFASQIVDSRELAFKKNKKMNNSKVMNVSDKEFNAIYNPNHNPNSPLPPKETNDSFDDFLSSRNEDDSKLIDSENFFNETRPSFCETLKSDLTLQQQLSYGDWFLPWWRSLASDAAVRSDAARTQPTWNDVTGDDWTSDLIEFTRLRLRPFTLLCFREINDVLFQLCCEHVTRLEDLLRSIALPAIAQAGKGVLPKNELPPLDISNVQAGINVVEFVKKKALNAKTQPVHDLIASGLQPVVQQQSQQHNNATDKNETSIDMWTSVSKKIVLDILGDDDDGPSITVSKRTKTFNLLEITHPVQAISSHNNTPPPAQSHTGGADNLVKTVPAKIILAHGDNKQKNVSVDVKIDLNHQEGFLVDEFVSGAEEEEKSLI